MHRLLELDPRGNEFKRHDERPLDADVVIVDEVSMLDCSLAWHLLACGLLWRLLRRVVGPVGAAAGLPVFALLDNVRSVWNVGAMFRSADAAGTLESLARYRRSFGVYSANALLLSSFLYAQLTAFALAVGWVAALAGRLLLARLAHFRGPVGLADPGEIRYLQVQSIYPILDPDQSLA